MKLILPIVVMAFLASAAYASESCEEKCYKKYGQGPAGDRCAAACK